MILGSIEQDIPVHELLHLAPLSHEFELVEAQLTAESPAVGRTLEELHLPAGCSVVAIVRDEVARPVDHETVFRAGDKVIAAGRAECEPALHGMLIGEAPVA